VGVKRKNNDDYINGNGRKKEKIVNTVELGSVLSDDQINIGMYSHVRVYSYIFIYTFSYM
jgi:hypothetical protein